MERWQKRAVISVVAVVVLIFLSSLFYHYLMIEFEGRSPTYFNSLRSVVETYTGTGFGADSPWETDIANIFVVLMDLSTFLLVFIILPYILRPVLEEAFSPTLPESTEKTDHVVICGYGGREETLTDEFEARGVEFVVVDEDEESVKTLMEDGVPVVYGDPSSAEVLRSAGVGEASAVIVDTEDDESASVVLAIREVNEEVRVIVLVRSLELERYLEYSGADTVLTPRHLLGRRMAERAETTVSPRLGDTVKLGEEFSLVELTVHEHSQVCGKSVEEIDMREETGTNIIGIWKGNEFIGAPSPDTVVEKGDSLLVAGDEEQLTSIKKMTISGERAEPYVVIAGHGEVGSTVKRSLRASGTRCKVMDLEEGEGVDVVGDATDEDKLVEAGIDEATAFVVAVTDDDQAILSTLVANEVADDIDVIARVNESKNKRKIRRAGADYVLSLPDISGRMLALEILEEDVITVGRQLKIVRTDAPKLVGSRLGDADIREETGCVVVSVERDGETLTNLGSDFTFNEGDTLLVAGSDEDIDRFEDKFR